jgi:hypothetical protein
LFLKKDCHFFLKHCRLIHLKMEVDLRKVKQFKKALSLLLFAMISLGMSMPLYAGQLLMSNEFRISGGWSDTYAVDMSSMPPDTYNSASDTWRQSLSSRGAYEIQPGISVSWDLEAYATQWGYDTTSEDAELSWKTVYGTWRTELFTLDVGYIDCNLGTYASARESGGFAIETEMPLGVTMTAFAVLESENAEYDYIDDDIYYYDEDTEEYSTVSTNGALTDDGEEQDSYVFGIGFTKAIGPQLQGGPGGPGGPGSQDGAQDGGPGSQGGQGAQVGAPVAGVDSDVLDWINEDDDDTKGGGPGGRGMHNEVGTYLAVAIDQAYGTERYVAGADVGYTMLGADFSAFVGTFWGSSYDSMMGLLTEDIAGVAVELGVEKSFSDSLTAALKFYWTPGDTDLDDDTTIYADWAGRGEGRMLTDGGGVELFPMDVSLTALNSAGVYGGTLSGEYSLSRTVRLEAGVAYGVPAIDIDDQASTPMSTPWESILQLNAGYTYSVSRALEFKLGASFAQMEGNDTYTKDMWGTSGEMSFKF